MSDEEPDEVRAAHKLLETYYGEPVRPVSKVCASIWTWLRCIRENHPPDTEPEDHRDEAMIALGQASASVTPRAELAAAKSNLLYRLLYLGLEPRPKKCPVHKGRWSGCVGWDDPVCGCVVGNNVTGWVDA